MSLDHQQQEPDPFLKQKDDIPGYAVSGPG
jgi:hypothetical protein